MKERTELFSCAPYRHDRAWRRPRLQRIVAALTRHHFDACVPYRQILTALNMPYQDSTNLEAFPCLPAGLFKHLDLSSVPESGVRRTLRSSGTTRQTPSRVHLDRTTALLQMRALACIVADFLEGQTRLPLLVLDSPAVAAAGGGRAVAIQGFSLFGSTRTFALDAELRLDRPAIEAFVRDTKDKPVLIFGFTSVIWLDVLEQLRQADVRLELPHATLIHGGGWKRLAERQVSDVVFKAAVRQRLGVTRIHNYYGMVEQAGSIHMQCDRGYLHSSHFSDVFIRRARDFSVAEPGEPGIIQTISVLPESYPGHNLLTEDEGVLHGEDDCACGRRGKYFEVTRRLPTADPKGCGDTHGARS